MMSFLKNRIVRSFIGLFVVSILTLAPFSPSFQYQNIALQVQTAEAGGPCYTATGPCSGLPEQLVNAGSNAASAVSNSLTAWATNILGLKEITLDGIAWGIINIILQEMIRSITAWVNAGFPDGGPAFVQDFAGFLKNIADGLVGDFILGSPLGFMCSPFQLDVQLSMAAQYLFGRDAIDPDELGYQSQCRMTDVINNINNFSVSFDSDLDVGIELAYDSSSFAAGGWAWVLEATNDQENNVFGAQASAQVGLAAVLRNAKGEETKLLDWGEGFLNVKTCDPPGSKHCTIQTPGAVIEAQLNNALFGGQQRLTIADEINELIAALFTQLVRQALGGLFGMTSSPFSSGGTDFDSYFDALSAGTGGGVGFSYSSLGDSAINEARGYITNLDRLIGLATTSRDVLDRARADFPGEISLTVTPSVVRTEANDARDARGSTTRQIAAMERLQDDYATAASSSSATSTQAQIDILNDIIDLQTDMPGALQAAQVNNLITDTINPALVTFYATLSREITAAGGDPRLYIPAAFQ